MIPRALTLAKTYRAFDKTTAPGLYLSVVPNPRAEALLKDLASCLDLPLTDFETSELHCTVVYSRAIPETVDTLIAELDSSAIYELRLTGVEWWDGHDGAGYLVARCQSPALVELNAKWARAGCTSTYAKYNPHITLKKDIGPKQPDFYERRKAVYDFVGTTFCMTRPTVESLKK